MENRKIRIGPKAGPKGALGFLEYAVALSIVIALVFSFGACRGSGADDGNGMDIAIDKGGKGEVADPEPEPGVNEPGESAYDEQTFPLKKNFTPTFPEFADSIEWFEVPKDYIGGFDEWLEPKEHISDGYINVRDAPLLSGNLIGKMERGSEEIRWWRIIDTYQEDGRAFAGYYSVEADDYVWTPVKSDEAKSKVGWVVLDLVEFFGI